MASQFSAHLIEAALLDLFAANLSAAYEQTVDVNSIGKSDFDDDGQLIMKSPAVRLYFAGSSATKARDVTYTTMERETSWSALCFHESLRSRAAERTKTLALVAVVEAQLAGARLKLADGNYTLPLMLQGVNQAVDAMGPVDQCYAVSFLVSGIAVFPGVNSNFGVKA